MTKRITSLLLALIMVLSLIPAVVFGETPVANGTCGENLTWVLDSAGNLTISGEGEMDSWQETNAPWYSQANAIRTVSLDDGVLSIGAYAFAGCTGLEEIYFEGAPSIGEGAFSDVTATAYYPCGNAMWTDTAQQNYGGVISWTPLESSHQYVLTVSPPTYTDQGYTLHTCSYCGHSFKDNYVAALTLSSPMRVTGSCWPSTGNPHITWEAVDDADSYEIYRASSETGDYTRMYTTTSTGYTNTTAVPGRTYYYKVKAITGDASSSFSAVVSCTCCCATPVAKISTSAASGKPTMKWSAVDGAAKYEIWRATSKTGTYTKMYTTSNTSYTNTTATAGYTYYYKVRALASNNIAGAFSDIHYITCDCAQPVLSVNCNATNVYPTLSWSAVAGAAKYYIYRSTDGGNTYKYYTSTTATTYSNTAATAGNTYFYKIKAISSKTSYADSAYSAAKSVACMNAPVITSAANAENGVTLKWSAVNGAEKYRLYYKVGNGDWTKNNDTVNTSYTVKGLRSGVKYSFSVRCVNSAGTTVVSPRSASKSITYIAAPVISSADAVSDGVTVKWGKVTGATAYRVFYKSGSEWKKLADTTGTSYTDTGISIGGSRTYTVRCLSSDKASYTSSYNHTGVVGKRLATPRVSYYGDKGKIILKWDKISGAEKYRIYKIVDGSWKWLADITSNTYTVSANSGEYVCYAVRCISADGKNRQSCCEPAAGQYTTFTQNSTTKTLAGCGSYSKTGGLTDAQQEAILKYFNALYSSIGSFKINTNDVLYNSSIRAYETAVWNSLIAVRKNAIEDLSLSRYRVLLYVSSVKTVSSNSVKVTVWESNSQQFRSISTVSQEIDTKHYITLTKGSTGRWYVSNHSAEDGPYYSMRNDTASEINARVSKLLNQIAARQKYFGVKTGKGVTCNHPYNRNAAREYMLKWAGKRNENWYAYDNNGGNCMNFASQAMYAGGIHMTDGWYWKGAWNVTSSWINVGGFANYAAKATGKDLCCSTTENYYSGDVGDLIFIGVDKPRNHATIISEVIRDEEGRTVDYLLCCNTTNLKNFPAAAYHYTNQQLIRIYGWN